MSEIQKNPVFDRDVSFAVSENSLSVGKLRLFGENLLHVELGTDYGKKEFVCGCEKAILNHVMLKNGNEIERLSAYVSYEIAENGIVKVSIFHSEATSVWQWNIDLTSNTVEIVSLDESENNILLTLSPLEEQSEE